MITSQVGITSSVRGEILTLPCILGDPRIDWVRIVFEQERLPYKEGAPIHLNSTFNPAESVAGSGWRPHVVPSTPPNLLSGPLGGF